jgi:mono/diheme cytochrome c family protein
MTRQFSRWMFTLTVLGLAGCKGHEFHPPDKDVRVEQADSVYARMRFDTIQWASDSLKLATGNEVYASNCDKCHGPTGQGNAEYARANNLRAPSLVDPNWHFGEDREQVRRRIFTGHPAGMPTWGVAGLTPREIDAVTSYLMDSLRPEFRSTGAVAPAAAQ